jgi:hypothetical protein
MKASMTRILLSAACSVTLLSGGLLRAQTTTNERAFPQSKATLEKVLKDLQANMAGHLPSLEGFAAPAEHSLDRYQRGFYQDTVQVNSTPSGGSLVLVSTKLTAWYNDPISTHSGYQLLVSNGRLESDFLDLVSDQLSKGGVAKVQPTPPIPVAKPSGESVPTTAKATPSSEFSDAERKFSSSLTQSMAAQERELSKPQGPSSKDQPNLAQAPNELQAEAESLEEILKNQGHPKNLVAVKKSGTPVVGSPSLTAKPLFLASMHDEFEMLDFNADWVHVRVSGLSRGWIWRNSLEMPEGIPDTGTRAVSAVAPAADLFHVIREETAPFPGDWAPLRGKNVKILSVQKIDENAKDSGANARLEYAKSLLDKSYTEIAKKPEELSGVVVIFDSADGGMVAATVATLQQWRAGTLSDAAMWHKCFFDPPETFDSAASGASQ